mgnify:CR=1 FL=1
MLQIENWKVYDLKESVIACRNAMRITPAQITDEEFNASMPRAIILANSPSGSGHQTFLSGIRVSFDIKYPNYISPELQRYHWIDIVSSSSKMHRLSSMDMDTCFNKYVTDESKEQMKRLVKKFNDTKSYEDFMVMLSNCPQGIELFMRVSTNYLQLRTLYRQRKTHKLKEDWGEVCEFIEKLPYANEFIIGNNSNN